jgi:regulator of protease activity HflC (stomatin/prohibitin superfamily)
MTDEHLGQKQSITPQVSSDPPDAAMKSLADALRVSFKLLSFIMVLFVVLFLATGIESVEEQDEIGIVKVFGKVTSIAKPGLTYNWPFPIGEIELVKTQERRLSIENFWMFELAAEKGRDLSRRRRGEGGLVPGKEGYLMTADRSLIHIKFDCTYRVQNPLAFKGKLSDPEAVLRSVLCEQAVAAAATRTADALQSDHTDFFREIQQKAQVQLDMLMDITPGETQGIVITNVLLPQGQRAKTWPLAAYTAYEQAQRAKAGKETKINAAMTKATDILVSTAGARYRTLVGDPARLGGGQPTDMSKKEDYDLIGQYSKAQEELDAAKASGQKPERIAEYEKKSDVLLQKIDDNLASINAGTVKTILADAGSAKTRAIQNAIKRGNTFDKLYSDYTKAPELFLETEWANTIDKIFAEPTVTKYYTTVGADGTVLHLSPDPKINKEIRDTLRKSKSDKK